MKTLTESEVNMVSGGVDWMDVLVGAAVIGAVILTVATAGADIPILSIAGGAALTTEAAGGGMMVVGAAS